MSERHSGGLDAVESLSALIGRTIVEIEPARWGVSTRTDIAVTSDGARLVVQRFPHGPAARHRIRSARSLTPLLDAAGIPVPRIVTADPAADPPFLVTTFVPGRAGAEMLDDPVDAIALGTEMGRLVRRLGDVPTAALRLPSTWADPVRLAAAATRWLDRTTRLLDASTAAMLAAVFARLPDLFAGRPAVLAHGDWAPVNVVVESRAVAAVVDWEFARLADPLFDVAWWGWLVRYHHPDAVPHAWPAFLETAGVELDEMTADRLRALVSLRLLEALASARRDDPRALREWVRRIEGAVGPID